MSDYYILDKDKNVIRVKEVMEWADFFENAGNKKIVRQEHVGHYFVSTVFIGMDYGYGERPPQIFETMVFYFGESSDHYCDRYATWQEAEEGHKKAVKWVKNGCRNDD
jgi:hypothetical protein